MIFRYRWFLTMGLTVWGALAWAADYATGENLIRNPEFKAPYNAAGIPHGWMKLRPNTKGGETEVKPDGGGMLLYFTGPDYVDQIRLTQTMRLEKGKVYEVMFEYRSDACGDLNADVTFWGTGVFMRSWWLTPSTQWTKVRGLFLMHVNANPNGEVILTMQNRSRVKLWYRNIFVRATDVKADALPTLIPAFKVHSVRTDDVFITPDNHNPTAEFLVNGFSDEALSKYRVTAVYYPSALKPVECLVSGRHISVPLESIGSGKTKLRARLWDRRDNALVATAEVTIDRIMKLPAGVDFNRAEAVRLPNGKKFFPIGIYAGVDWNFSVNKLVDNGFNVIHTYASNRREVVAGQPGFNPTTLRNTVKLLDDAGARGAYVMIQLPHDYTEKTQDVSKLPAWIGVYKNHPAVLGYYVDETRSIKNTPYPIIKAAYDTARRSDPSRQWFAYENPDPELRNSMDVIICGVSSPAMRKLCSINIGSEKPVIHCFGQIDYMSNKASSLEYNQYNLVMPIIWGARGVFYFMYDNLYLPKANPECALLAERVLSSFRRFAPVAPAIVSDDPVPSWATAVKTSGPAVYKVFALNGKVYLFGGTANFEQETGQLRLVLPEGVQVREVLSDSPVKLNGRMLDLQLAPGRSGIWELSNTAR